MTAVHEFPLNKGVNTLSLSSGSEIVGIANKDGGLVLYATDYSSSPLKGVRVFQVFETWEPMHHNGYENTNDDIIAGLKPIGSVSIDGITYHVFEDKFMESAGNADLCDRKDSK